jgi:site-specific DNA recombinase
LTRCEGWYTMSDVTTCDILIRLSDLRVEESLEGRETNLRSFATNIGWTVQRVVVENDVTADGKSKPASAWKRRKIRTPSGRTELRTVRPGFREVLDDITTGRVDGLIAEDLDRVVRDPRDLEDLLDACAPTDHRPNGASARSPSGSLTITNGGNDGEKFMARVMVAQANKSSADTSRRVKNSRNTWHGRSYFGGLRPYGYTVAQDTEQYGRTLIIVDDEADILRTATDDILNKDISLHAIVRNLNERGIPTVMGGKWTTTKLRQVLVKPAIAGLHAHNGEMKDAPWDAILERDVWEKLKAKLDDPARIVTTGNEPRWLLSKIARCGICDDDTTVFVTATKKDTGPAYVCDKKYHLRRNVCHADAWIERNVTAYISENGMDILKPEPREDIDTSALRAEMKRLRERKTAQMRMHADGEIDDADLKAGMRYINDRLRVIDAQLAQADQPDPLPEFRRHGPTREIWSGLSLARKRAIIKMLVDVTMHPTTRRGPGFDPDSVKIVIKETGDVLDVRQWPETDATSPS